MKKFYRSFFLLILAAAVPSLVWAADDEALWKSSTSNGGWRAFGVGMLQAADLANGLRMEVDWKATTFGIGAVYGGAESENTLPLENKDTLVLEAKSSVEDGTLLAPEWVGEDGKKSFRIQDANRAALTADWQTLRFKIPDDFPGLGTQIDRIKGLRLLFINPAKPGRGDVMFRDVRLEP